MNLRPSALSLMIIRSISAIFYPDNNGHSVAPRSNANVGASRVHCWTRMYVRCVCRDDRPENTKHSTLYCARFVFSCCHAISGTVSTCKHAIYNEFNQNILCSELRSALDALATDRSNHSRQVSRKPFFSLSCSYSFLCSLTRIKDVSIDKILWYYLYLYL